MRALALAAGVAASLLATASVAQVKVSALPPSSSVTGDTLVPCVQASVTYRCTAAQIAALAPTQIDVSGKMDKAGGSFTGAVAFSTIKPTILGYSPWTTQDFNYLPASLGANTYSGLQTLNGRLALNQAGAPDDAYGLAIERNSNFTGGTVGYVNRGLSCHTTVQGSPNDYEWCGVFVLDNSATGSGQHVGAYFQGNRRAAGVTSTWAAVSEAKDWSGAANPTSALIAHEFDVEANGSDVNFNRVGLDVFAKTKPGGPAASVGFGLRLNSEGNAAYLNEVALVGSAYTALLINPPTTTFGINFLGAYTGPVIDFSQITSASTNAMFRFKAGQSFCWEATCNYRVQMQDPATSGYANSTVINFSNGFAESVGLRLDTGSEGLRVDGVPMVGLHPNSALFLPGAYSHDLALRLPNSAGGTLYFQTFSGASTLASLNASGLTTSVGAFVPSLGVGTSTPIRQFELAGSGTSGELVIAQPNGQTDARKWELLVDGGSASVPSNLTIRRLNDAGNGGYVVPMLFNSTAQTAEFGWRPTYNGADLVAGSNSYTAFTPAVSFFSGSTSVSSAQGRWQRAGATVNYRFQVTFAAGGSGAGPIVALPSVASNTLGAVCVGKVVSTGLGLSGQINPNVGTVGVSKYDGSGYAPGNETITMSCTYEG